MNRQEIESEFDGYITQLLQAVAPTFPLVLYHYTSERGIRGVVQSGRMRASNIEEMNDHAEVRYATSVMRAHLDRAYAYEPDTAVAKLLNSMRRQTIGFDLRELFVLSFTHISDDEGMWRLYGNRGHGYSFCFHTADAKLWGGFVLRCQYDAEHLNDLCSATLQRIRSLFLALEKTSTVDETDELAGSFIRKMSWLAAMFKPAIWRDEEEWRLLFHEPDRSKHHTENGRTFIEVPSDGHVPIQAVCAGPNCDRQGSIQPLYELLRARGYRAMEIRQRPELP